MKDNFIKDIRHVCLKFNLKPLEVLGHRDYVVRAKDEEGKTVIVKTDHLEDEVEVLTLLNNSVHYQKQRAIVIPKIIKSGKKFLIQEDLGNNRPPLSVKESNSQILERTLEGIVAMQKILREENKLKNYVKKGDNQLGTTKISASAWLKERLLGWQKREETKEKWLLPKDLVRKMGDCLNKLSPRPVVINLGAASAEHIRLFPDGKIGFFDFGRHLRWAPREYDAGYLWWGFLRDSVFVAQKVTASDFSRVAALILKISQSLDPKINREYFYGCILERLSGISKDLSSLEKNPMITRQRLARLRNLQLELIESII